LKGPKVIKSKL